VAANKVTLLVEHVGIIGLHISRSQVALWSRSFLIALFIYIYIYIYMDALTFVSLGNRVQQVQGRQLDKKSWQDICYQFFSRSL
jgi:hypothetical protein